MNERENALVKSTAMGIALALSFGGCAGYAIGFKQGQGSVAPLRVEPIGAKQAASFGKTWRLDRAYYRTEAGYQAALRQMRLGDH